MANLLTTDKPLWMAIVDGLTSNSSTEKSHKDEPNDILVATEALTGVLKEMGLILGKISST